MIQVTATLVYVQSRNGAGIDYAPLSIPHSLQPPPIGGPGHRWRPAVQRRVASYAAIVLLSTLALRPALGQVSSTPAPPGGTPGWSFAITPYFWLATIRSSFVYGTRLGDSVTDHINAGINDYISDLNFAAMVGAEARYDRFSLMTDGIFTSLSLTRDTSHLDRLNLRSGTIDIPRQQQLGTGTRTNLGVWGLAAGYTVVEGDWGNLDVLGGVRLLAIGSRTNYLLSDDVRLPNRTVVLAREGSLSLGADYVDVIAGVRGRVNIPNSRLFVPFYFDIGSAGIPLTWQVYVGLGYHLDLADLSLGYRYLDFRQNGNRSVQNLSLGGAILAATFRF
jgi:hypothetical protein